MDEFSLFCSYAHSDNDDGWVDNFTTSLIAALRKLTGVQPKVFLDHESLITAEIWEKRISTVLSSSQLLIAIISPSYVKSTWCRREWTAIASREVQMRKQGLLGREQGLIFPILLFPLKRGSFSTPEEEFAAEIKERQWFDVSSQLDGTPLRPHQVRSIAEQIIDTTADLARRRRNLDQTVVATAPQQTIVDPTTGLEWSATLSSKELLFDEAIAYATSFKSEGWRLPSKKELESIIDQSALVDDPKASPFPLREPFNSQRSGYLHSGTKISPEGHYIMNVRNGHIFNGFGYRGYVRLVRKRPNKAPEPTPTYVASL